MIPYATVIDITQVISTPILIAAMAVFSLISNIAAISAPVHAPIPGNGSGIATKSNKPINTPRRSLTPLDFAFSSNLSANLPNVLLIFRIHANILRINKMINGTGKILPIKHVAALSITGNPSANTPIWIVVIGFPTPGKTDIMKMIMHRPGVVVPNISYRD